MLQLSYFKADGNYVEINAEEFVLDRGQISVQARGLQTPCARFADGVYKSSADGLAIEGGLVLAARDGFTLTNSERTLVTRAEEEELRIEASAFGVEILGSNPGDLIIFWRAGAAECWQTELMSVGDTLTLASLSYDPSLAIDSKQPRVRPSALAE